MPKREGGPPRAAEWLLQLLVPGTRAELILGDLAEDYAEAVASSGVAAARRQYWRAALRSIAGGGVWHRSTRSRERRGRPSEALVLELRQAVRSLARRPAFATVMILTLAIGASAATAAFSVVNGVLLRPPSYEDPHELFTVWKADAARRSNPAFAASWNRIGLSLSELDLLDEQRDVFSAVGGYRTERVIVTGAGEPQELVIARATAALLPVLGVYPALGIWFDGSDPHVAVLGHTCWRKLFAADAAVLGRAIRLGEQVFVVVGVLPRSFGIEPLSPFMQQGQPCVWVPAGAADSRTGDRDFEAVVRVPRRIDPAHAAARAARAITDEDGRRRRHDVVVERRHVSEVARVRGPLLLVLATAGLFVVLACVNVASLTLAEGATRRQELVTRAALGATGARIRAQLVLESAVVGLSGAVVGGALAFPLRDLLLRLAPFTLPVRDLGPDVRLLVFVAAVAIAMSLSIGLPSAWLLGREAAHALYGRVRGTPTRRALVVTQFALVTTLLTSAGLLSRSLALESRVPPGFATEGRLVVQVRRPPGLDPDFNARVRDALAGVPGVAAVAVTSRVPLLDPVGGWQIVPEGEDAAGTPVLVNLEVVSDGYFELMRIPVIEGRAIDQRDVRGTRRVAVVSETLARRLWPDRSGVGRTVQDPFGEYTIVGVARDVRDLRLDLPSDGVFYPAMAQSSLPGGTAFLLRIHGDPTAHIAAVRARVRAAAPGAAVLNALPLARIVDDVLAADRYRAIVALMMAAAAALIAAIGLAGMVIRDVTRRLKQLAIRMALGATPWSIARLSMQQAVVSVGLGALAGVIGSFAAGRVLTKYLFGVRDADPIALLATLATLGVIMLITLALALRRIAAPDLLRHLGTG